MTSTCPSRWAAWSSSCNHCKGETDDHTWVWCPQRRVVCPGDLFIWAVPNDGNPQKVQRYPVGARERFARDGGADAKRAVPWPWRTGGGRDRENRAHAERDSGRSSTWWSSRTLAAMEAGSPPHVDIVTGIESAEIGFALVATGL